MATKTADLTDQIDGVLKSFSTPEIFVAGSLVVSINGVRQRPLVDYTEDVGLDGFTFDVDCPPLISGDTLLIQYEIDPANPLVFPIVTGSGS